MIAFASNKFTFIRPYHFACGFKDNLGTMKTKRDLSRYEKVLCYKATPHLVKLEHDKFFPVYDMLLKDLGILVRFFIFSSTYSRYCCVVALEKLIDGKR